MWAWKDITSRKKQLELIPLTFFWVVWKEGNRKVFEEVEEGLDKNKKRWSQTFSVLILNQPMYYRENLGELIDVLIEL